MIGGSTDALEQALALHAKPGRMSVLHNRPLPNAVLFLIRIAAGDAEALSDAATRTSETRKVVVEAAVLYIQHVLFHESSDSYRLLGVPADAHADAIKENYRWLMRWLHPDRHPERWEVVYSERVNRAWNSLNSEQRRHDYDAQIDAHTREADASNRLAPMRGVKPRPVPVASRPLLSPQWVRRLPVLVLGGMALVATIGLTAFYWVQRDQRATDLMAAEKLASRAAVGDSSAQEAAIRQRIAFDEHVIEMSQPAPPASRAAAPAGPEGGIVASPIEEYPTAPSASAVADAGPVTLEAMTSSSVPSSPLASSAPSPHATALAQSPPQPAAPPRPVVPPKPPSPHQPVIPAQAGIALRSEPKSDSRLRGNDELKGIERSAPPIALQPQTKPASATNPESSNPQPVAVLATTTTPAVTIALPAIAAPQQATTEVPRQFEQAYAKGDLAGMMRLFAPDAVDNRGGIGAIRQDYDQLFRGSSVHELRLDELRWIIQPNRIVGSGGFIAQIRHNDEQITRQVRGWIQIEAVPIDGSWKIQRLIHRNAE